MKYYIYLFIMLSFILSCKSEDQLLKYKLTKFVKVDEIYQYSGDLFYFEKNKYKPIYSSYYLNDTIQSIEVFKSEGKMFYSKIDLNADPMLLNNFDIEKVKKIKRSKDKIIDNDLIYQITKDKGDSVLCQLGNKLILFNIEK